jgi:protein SCO1/2
VKWILNLAYMTLGKYPDGVPSKDLITAPATEAPGESIRRFVDVAHEAGLDAFQMSGGVIVEDFENRGLFDVVTSGYDVCGHLLYFHNNGDGTFSDRSEAAGLAKIATFANVIQADYNNDGCMDILVLREVRDSRDLKAIRRGMLVDFTVVVDSGAPYAEKVKVHQFESPDQRPLEVHMLKMIEGAFEAKPNAVEMLAVDQKVPDFSLVDQYGRHVKFSDWSGKVIAISFVYTRCSFPEYCFRLSNNLGLVGKRFADRMDRDLVLLTITFDPASDSPGVLSKYANTWKASAKGWYFLTGPPAEVKRVCLLFGMNFWPEMGMLAHTMHTAVIDPQGRLVTNLEGNEFSGEQLGNLLETVMRHKP